MPGQPDPPRPRHAPAAALAAIVAASAAPYGYTISIWSSGAVLMRSHGTPRVGDVFAFVAGAVIAFALLALLTRGAVAEPPTDRAPDRVLAGAMHLLAAGAAVGAAALLAELDGWEAWPLGSFAATATYLLGAGAELALVSRLMTARRAAPAVRIEQHTGPRAELRPLFELAEDSPTQLDSYLDSGASTAPSCAIAPGSSSRSIARCAVALDMFAARRHGRRVTDQPATSAVERRNLADADLTKAVEASFDNTPDPRLREVLQSLVRHLHAFAGEVELTEKEWFAAIDFLTRTGHITDDKRQEFVLASDVMGLSMLVIGINHRHPSGATESTVFGPFFVEGSPAFENGDDIANGAPGIPCHVSGVVRAVGGEPVPGARLEIWQADEDGLYDVQYEGLEEARGRGHLHADDEGRYRFWTVHPEAYPIPVDGPVGELLAATHRSPMRPAHIHFMVTAPGYQTLITHVFDEDDQYLDTDAVFGVRSSLLASFERHEGGTGPDGRAMDGPWSSTEFDLVIAPD